MRASLRVVTGLLAVAFASAPLVVDQCVIACDVHLTGSAGPAPTCHHLNSATIHMTSGSMPCGHAHNGMRSLTADTSPTSSSAHGVLAMNVSPVVLNLMATARVNDASASLRPRTSIPALAV